MRLATQVSFMCWFGLLTIPTASAQQQLLNEIFEDEEQDDYFEDDEEMFEEQNGPEIEADEENDQLSFEQEENEGEVTAEVTQLDYHVSNFVMILGLMSFYCLSRTSEVSLRAL